ncbi:hypothetical protein [uncultured Thiocystis sp.]|nr:hypothetical protein [uncultured Thiocystis sp.]
MLDHDDPLEDQAMPSGPMPIGVNAIPAASAVRVGEQRSLF